MDTLTSETIQARGNGVRETLINKSYLIVNFYAVVTVKYKIDA